MQYKICWVILVMRKFRICFHCVSDMHQSFAYIVTSKLVCIDEKPVTESLNCTTGNIYTYNAGVYRTRISDCSNPNVTEHLNENRERCDNANQNETNSLTYNVRQACNTKSSCNYTFSNTCKWKFPRNDYNQTYFYVEYICFSGKFYTQI